MIKSQESQPTFVPNPLMSPVENSATDFSTNISTEVQCFASVLFELDMIKKNRIMSNLKYKNNKYRNKNYTFYQIWFPPDHVPIRAKIFLLHEICEHLGRWHSFAQHLASQGYIVYAIDFYNHGRSSGTPRGYIEHWKLIELQTKLFFENEILIHADLVRQYSANQLETEEQESDTSSASSDISFATQEIQQWKIWKLKVVQEFSSTILTNSQEWDEKVESLQNHPYPIVLCGYGFGATMALLLSLEYQQIIHSTVLLSPIVQIPSTFYVSKNSTSSILFQQQSMIQTMNYFVPMLEMVSINLQLLTHEEEQKKLYQNDSLICKSKLRCNTLFQLLDASKRVAHLLIETKYFTPHILLLHGQEDSYSPAEASRYIAHLLSDKNTQGLTLKIYEDMYHDLLHETNSTNQVMNPITLWLQKHLI